MWRAGSIHTLMQSNKTVLQYFNEGSNFQFLHYTDKGFYYFVHPIHINEGRVKKRNTSLYAAYTFA